MEKKVCKICGETKDINDFGKHSTTKDQHQNNCKTCASKLTKKWRDKNKDKYLDYMHNYFVDNKIYFESYNKNWCEKNEKKVLAHRAVHRAIRDGLLDEIKECSMCKTTDANFNYHHLDYDSDGLNVIGLCRQCHRKLHAKEKRELINK